MLAVPGEDASLTRAGAMKLDTLLCHPEIQPSVLPGA